MKNATQEQLCTGRPDEDPWQAVQFCLDRLVEDKTKNTHDCVVLGLSYEELIGALLLARDAIERCSVDHADEGTVVYIVGPLGEKLQITRQSDS